MSRLNNDVVGAQTAISNTIVSIITDIVQVVAVAAVMLALEWRLTLISVSIVPFFICGGAQAEHAPARHRPRNDGRQRRNERHDGRDAQHQRRAAGQAVRAHAAGSGALQRAGEQGARSGHPARRLGRDLLRADRPVRRRRDGAGLRHRRLSGQFRARSLSARLSPSARTCASCTVSLQDLANARSILPPRSSASSASSK